jgi:hypothetical protein
LRLTSAVFWNKFLFTLILVNTQRANDVIALKTKPNTQEKTVFNFFFEKKQKPADSPVTLIIHG